MAKKSLFLPPKEGIVRPPLVIAPHTKPCPNLFTAVLVDNPVARAQFRQAMRGARAYAVDTETTGLRVELDRIIGMCFSVPPWTHGFYIPMYNSMDDIFYQHQSTFDDLVEFFGELLTNDTPKYFHNGMYDVPIIYHNFKILCKNIAEDSMLKSHVLDADSLHGLKDVANRLIHANADWYEQEMLRYNSAVGGSPKKPKYWLIPVENMASYGCGDAVFTGRIVEQQSAMMEREPKLKRLYYNVTIPLMHRIMDMRLRGICVDRDYLQKGQWTIAEECQNIIADIREDVGDFTLNVDSPPQLAKLLYEKLKLPTGRKGKTGYSTDEDELDRLKGSHPVVDKILLYRGKQKESSTYFEPLMNESSTGRFYADVKIHGTRTGRLSMSRLHQIPKGPLIRSAFVAEPGRKLVHADMSQLEARVLAHFSQDPELLRIYQNKEDIHSATAYALAQERVGGFEIIDCGVDEIKKKFPKLRDKGKTINFALLYLESIAGLMHQLGCSYQEAEIIYNAYWKRYAGVLPWGRRAIREGYKRGYVEMISGRRRYLKDIFKDVSQWRRPWPKSRPQCFAKPKYKGGIAMSLWDMGVPFKDWTPKMAEDHRPFLKGVDKQLCAACPALHQCYFEIEWNKNKRDTEKKEREILNNTIQGSAADLVNLGIIRTGEVIKEKNYDAFLNIYVHDEVAFSVKDDDRLPEFQRDFQEEMESVSEFLTLPLVFEPQVGYSWADVK